MRKNYKLLFPLVCVGLVLTMFIIKTPTKAMEHINTKNQTSTYSVKVLNWYMIAGQKTYSTSFYLESGSSVQIGVIPSVSSARYSVGILQPSGSERKVTKTGTTTTTYAISSSGYYKIFIHNVTSSALDYKITYAY